MQLLDIIFLFKGQCKICSTLQQESINSIFLLYEKCFVCVCAFVCVCVLCAHYILCIMYITYICFIYAYNTHRYIKEYLFILYQHPQQMNNLIQPPLSTGKQNLSLLPVNESEVLKHPLSHPGRRKFMRSNLITMFLQTVYPQIWSVDIIWNFVRNVGCCLYPRRTESESEF